MYFILTENGLGKYSSIFGVLIFIFKGIPELWLLADLLIKLFLAFYTFCIFKMVIYLFFTTDLIHVHFSRIHKNTTHINQNTTNLIF